MNVFTKGETCLLQARGSRETAHLDHTITRPRQDRIDQVPDAGNFRSFSRNDSLAGLFLGPALVAVALAASP